MVKRLGKGSDPRAPKPVGAVRKLIELDAETWHALRLLGGERMQSLQELAEEALADLLKKHGRPVTLKQALKESLHRQPANDPRPRGRKGKNLAGKWRIVEMELWDADFINLVGPGFICLRWQGRRRVRFRSCHGISRLLQHSRWC